MANPNPEIWGNNENWIYSDLSYGIQSTAAIENGFCKPFVAEFDSSATTGYKGSLLQGINVANKITVNQPLDRSICPCGQSPDVSPWGKIAIFNENNDISTTPSRIVSSDSNINWFFCDRIGIGNNSRYYSKVYNHNNELGLAYQQFAPYAFTPVSSFNSCMRISPYVFYGMRSFVLTIQIHLAPKNATEVIVDTIWTNLDNWVTYKDTHDLIGLRLFARNCLSYNIITDKLTYNTDESQTGGQNSNQIAVIQDFIVNNNGSNTNTEFLTLNMQSGTSLRSGYIFDTMDVQNYPTSDYRRTNGVLPCWNYFDGQQVKRWKSTDNTDATFWYAIPYSQANYDKIMKIAALFGCYFTPTDKYEFDYDMLDNDLYLPILDNGVAHGQYTRGADNANNSLYTKNSIREIDYDPGVPPTPIDPNTYSNITGFNSISSGASATERYVLDAGNTRQLLSDLWTISHDIAGLDYDNYDYKILDSFLVTNPIDCIISLKRFPFSIPHTFSSAKTAVNLGKNHGSAEGYLTYNVFNTVQFAGINITPRFGNSFLDYAPYTEYELYVPFCGTVKLNAGDILGHTLNCRLQIDLITGACTAYIMADSLVIETMTGTVSCELALTGIDSATIDANIQNSVLNHVNARTNKEVSMLSPLSVGGLVSAFSNPFKTAGNISTAKTEMQRAEYELTHIQTQPHTMGTAGGLTGWYQEFNARLMIYYPEGDVITSAQPPALKNLTSYAHTTGFATIDNAALSNYSGFTVATNAILNFAATSTEKEMIESALNGGIFI